MSLCYCYTLWIYENCKVNAIIFYQDFFFLFPLTFWVHITCDIFLPWIFFCLFACLVPNFPSSNSSSMSLLFLSVQLLLHFSLVIFFIFILVGVCVLWNNFLGMVHVNCKICIKHDSVNSRTYSTVKWQTNRKQNEFQNTLDRDMNRGGDDEVLEVRGSVVFVEWKQIVFNMNLAEKKKQPKK